MAGRYCDKCGFHEDDTVETLVSCNCVKGKKYDLDRALSEIEEFLSENNFCDYDRNSLAGVASKDNPS